MMKEDHFSDAARSWDMNRMHTERTQAIVKAMADQGLLSSQMTGIEFGAGTGLLSIALKDHFGKITLLDSAQGMIDVCREKINDLGITHLIPLCHDLEKHDLVHEPVDMIFNQMALHHVEDVDLILKKFYQLLKPGGVLVIADLYTEDGTFHDHQSYVHDGFDPESLVEQLKRVGFVEPQYNECFIMTKQSETKAPQSYPVFIMTAKK